MLVIFDKMSPVDALKTSLRACLRNILPLSLYGAMMLLFYDIRHHANDARLAFTASDDQLNVRYLS
ncbi:MAG: hypothetical protein IPN81_14380 [Nitrosomonadales bacterium]|nr:hypothetical protein [Nitrosomonadales bacterium]